MVTENLLKLKFDEFTFEGYFKYDIREGFGVEKKEGNKGFIGFYRDNMRFEGSVLRDSRKG